MKSKYTYDIFISTAKQFEHSSDFRKAYPSLWATGHKKGWLKDCTWFTIKTKEPVYTYEMFIETAKKYSNSTDFRVENQGLYDAGTRNGWLKDITWFERPSKYTKEQIIEIASKYETTADFFNNEPKYYNYAKRRGWFDDLPLAKVRKDPGFWYVYENNYNEARKYKTIKEFQDKAGAAYSVAREKGWLDGYDWFERLSKPNGYWQVYENNREEAMKYRTRTEFAHANQAAYEWARKNGWLETYDWFEVCSFSSSFKLSMLKSGDLENMTEHQLIELIQQKKLPKEFSALQYTRANSERRLGRIRDLIQNIEENNEEAIEAIEQQEREFSERVLSQQVEDNGVFRLVVGEENNTSGSQTTSNTTTPALPTATLTQLHFVDDVLHVKPTDKAAEFLVAESMAKLRNAILEANENGRVNEELESIKSIECGEFASFVRDKMIDEYNNVVSIKEDSDYKFDVDGEYCPPSLMQKWQAYLLSIQNHCGNWCGTGAGKTNAFLFSTRHVGAKTTVAIVPNDVIDGLVNAIRRIYPNSRIVVPKSVNDIKAFGKEQYTYIVFNYEKFQNISRGKKIVEALLTNNVIDFVCLDEAQNIKVRDANNISNRSKIINGFLVNARKQNQNMKTLVMTATSCPNCIQEVRSILEALTGKEYPEIGNRTSVMNIHNAYKAMLLNGFRYVPKYSIVIKEQVEEIDCTDDIDLLHELTSNRDIDINEIEFALAKRKLEHLKGKLTPGTIVYSNWVDGMAKLLYDNIKSWGYKVECYNGLSGNKEGRKDIKDKFIGGKIDILVCSKPISTGVDGLQKRCNKLYYMSLPWTYDDKLQTDGRIYRQGSVFGEVELIIPQVIIRLEDGNIWSWDRLRLNTIETKRTLSSAVLDGYIQESYTLNHERLKHLAIEALKSGLEETVIERKDIEVDYTIEETEEVRKARAISIVNNTHRLANTSNHATMHKRFVEHPEEFQLYHDSRELDYDPVDDIADFINKHYKGKKIADLGCGTNKLSTLVNNGNIVTGFDHQQYRDHKEVVVADIGNLHGIVDDNEMDIAVFCLSLWGQDYEDYLNEAYRILNNNGIVFIVEPTHCVGEGKRYGTEDELINLVESKGFYRIGPVEKHNIFTYFRFMKEI